MKQSKVIKKEELNVLYNKKKLPIKEIARILKTTTIKVRASINKFKFKKRKLSLSKLGEKNGRWKGNNVGVNHVHRWVEVNKPRLDYCERCKKSIKKVGRLDLANKSGKYKRDIKDYEWVCRKCHMKEDGRSNKNLLKNIPKNVKRDKKGKFISIKSKNAGGEEN